VRERPSEHRREPARAPQHTQPVDERLQHLASPHFNRRRDAPGEQLEQSKELIREEHESIKPEHKQKDDCSRSHRKRRERPTRERLGARERGIEERYRREKEQHDCIEQPVDCKRCKRCGEGHRCFLRQCERSRNLAGASGHHVVHHHSHRRRAPERAKWKLAGHRLENRLPPAGAQNEYRRRAEHRRGEQQRIGFRQSVRYFCGRDSMERPVD